MPELLVELFSEEIPARMQARAAADFAKALGDRVAAAGLGGGPVESHGGLRRITAIVPDILRAAADRTEERKGPRADAPQGAIDGFLKSAGLRSIEEAERRETDKGTVLFAIRKIPGQPATALLPGVIADAIVALSWPKSMRWADGTLTWVRPLRRILVVFDGAPLAGSLALGGTVQPELAFSAETSGHRFLAPQPFVVTSAAEYRAGLANAFVQLDRAERRQKIEDGAAALAAAAGLTVVPDTGLVEEVAGLVDWPVPLIGRIDPDFMDLPAEVMTTSMRSHQKYFACRTRDGRLADRFIVVANMVTADGGQAIVAGNERVLRARLSDARFFWDQDRKQALESFAPQLEARVFHAKLGTVAERVQRIATLARGLAPVVGADPELAERAARLAKCDLACGMVGEFPELQGIMGRYYALAQGESEAVASAIAEHYQPAGPHDQCPTASISVVVALADKLDHLVSLMAAGERATGSGDPFGLRRAALGIIRLVRENRLKLDLKRWFAAVPSPLPAPLEAIETFVSERLSVALRDQGHAPGRVAAVLAGGAGLDLVEIDRRLAALGQFLGTDDGANLLAAYKRSANILRIEEKRDARSYTASVAADQLADPAEQALWQALNAVGSPDDPVAALAAFSGLRQPLDRFFETVTVNSSDASLRLNRLALLAAVRQTFDRVADFAAVEG